MGIEPTTVAFTVTLCLYATTGLNELNLTELVWNETYLYLLYTLRYIISYCTS